jgi:hypothetical protein
MWQVRSIEQKRYKVVENEDRADNLVHRLNAVVDWTVQTQGEGKKQGNTCIS